MSKISSDDVKKVAKLANLPISSEEESVYTEQLKSILDYIDQLNSVDTSNIEPTFNPTNHKSILRDDLEKSSLSQVDALANAPVKTNALFKTKGVFDNE